MLEGAYQTLNQRYNDNKAATEDDVSNKVVDAAAGTSTADDNLNKNESRAIKSLQLHMQSIRRQDASLERLFYILLTFTEQIIDR